MGQKRPCSEIKHRKKSNSNIVMKDRIRQIMEDQHLNQQNFGCNQEKVASGEP